MEKINEMAVIQAVPSSPPSTKCEPAWLADKIKMLFSSYRLDNYPEPKLFLAQVGMVLERYDAMVVAIVTSPLTGIQRKSKFPPSIAELVEECDRISADLIAEKQRRAQPKMVPQRVSHSPIPEGQDYDSMFKQYGRPIGFFEK